MITDLDPELTRIIESYVKDAVNAELLNRARVEAWFNVTLKARHRKIGPPIVILSKLHEADSKGRRK